MSRILALDQSSRCSGWSIFIDGKLEQWGHLNTDDPNIGKRLVEIRNFIIDKITTWDIDTIAFEDIQMQSAVGNNVQTFKALANVYGVVYEVAMEFNKEAIIIPSVTWKSQLGIKGKRRPEQKKNAQIWVKNIYGIDATQDECDSICIGTCALSNKEKEKGHDWSE